MRSLSTAIIFASMTIVKIVYDYLWDIDVSKADPLVFNIHLAFTVPVRPWVSTYTNCMCMHPFAPCLFPSDR